MYYDIEVINHINIDLIVIIITRMQSPARNATDILVLNSDPDSYFSLAVLSKRKPVFEIHSKSNLPSKQTRENYRVTQ